MERVTGIGGVFQRAGEAASLLQWYAEHLGVELTDWGAKPFDWTPGGSTTWAVFDRDTEYFGRPDQAFMVNFRVADLDAMLAQLRSAGVEVIDAPLESEFGRFGWGVDPEGTRFELWQPPDEEQSMTANDPFAGLPEVPSFTVTSTTLTEGGGTPDAQMSGAFGVPGGEDVSPQLSWSGAPEGTKSYAVTVYDPDAPTGSGFWHWAVADIPASVTELPEGAGDDAGSGLPEGVLRLRTDAGSTRFIGAAPPAGHGPHRYFFVIHALGTESIGVPADATPAFLGFNMLGHILGRAVLTVTAEIPA